MKRMLLLLIIMLTTLSVSVSAQPERTRKGSRPKQTVLKQVQETEAENPLVGFWIEYKRTQKVKRNKQVEIEFTDTTKLKLMADSSAHQYYDMGKTIQTYYGFEGTKFYYNTDKTLFDFLLNDDGLILRQNDTTSYFVKVDKLYFPPIKKLIPSATMGTIGSLDANFLQGEWKVYKKTDPQFDRKNVYLYKLVIGEAQEEQATYTVKAHFDNANTLVTDDGLITIQDKTMVLTTMGQTKQFDINLANDDEMILQDGEVVYFLKK